MTNIEVAFHPEATSEYVASYIWYHERGPHLAEAFEHEVERGLRLITDAPERWPVYIAGYRRMLVRRFPFTIIYKHTSTTITVMALAHEKRKPGYWKKREK